MGGNMKSIRTFVLFLFLLMNLHFLNAQFKRFYYAGSIDNKYQIGFDIKIENNTVRGKYFYFSQSNSLWLDGKIDKKGLINISESDNQGNPSGSFNGTISKDYSSVVGFWTSKDKKKKLPFKLFKEAEYKELRHNRYNAAVEYPVFSVNGNRVYAKIDEAIQYQANEYYRANLHNIESARKELDDPGEIDKYSFESFFNVRFIDEQIISVSVIHEEFTGGAHPNYYFSCFTYDKSGNIITLNSVLDISNSAWNQLDKLITGDLQKKEAAWVVDGSHSSFEKELRENQIPYIFTMNGIEFYFAPYVAGYYAQGSFVAVVPYDKIKNLIKPNCPIKHLIK